MYKHIAYLLSVAAAALLLSGCQKNEMTPSSLTMTVTAYSDDAASAKSSLESTGSVIWNTSDHISLFYEKTGSYDMADFACTSVEESGRKAVFTGSALADGASSYVALYPYYALASCSSGGTVGSAIPGLQTATALSYDPSAAISVARGTDKNSLYFRNQVSLLGIKPLDSGITSATLIGSSPMTGKFQLQSDGTLVPGAASRSVRMEGAMASGTEYYASVLPGSQTGLKIVLGRNDGKFASFSGGAIALGSNELRHLFEAGAGSWVTPSTLYINEVQCNAAGAKIELYNPGSSAVSLYGWVLVKNDSELYAFSQGTSVPAGGFQTVLCSKDSEAEGACFGLDGTAGFDLKLCCGVVVDHVDNLTSIRTIADGHSLGRLTDGGKIWTAFSTATIGSSNAGGIQEPATSGIRLSEINGDYSGGDYIELYNAGSVTESLKDFKIRRCRFKDGTDDEQTLWKGTSGVTLAPGAYLTLYYQGDLEDNKTYPYRLQRDFSAKKNTFIWLQDAEEREVDSFQRGTKNSGWNNINMQKVENSSGVAYSYSYVGGSWVYANPTPGAVNAASAGNIDQRMCPVVINEINIPGNWVELYNMGNASVDINGLQLRWSRVKSGVADNQTAYEWETSTVIAPGGYLKVSSTKVNLASYASKNIHIRLRSGSDADFTGEKIIWDDFKRGSEGANWTTVTLGTTIVRSIVRVPDGSGNWYLGDASPALTNGTDKSGGLCPDVDQ